MRRARRTAALALALAAGMGTAAASTNSGRSAAQQISHGDLAASCTAGAESGTLYPGSAVEPYVATDPLNPRRSIGVFEQDRWSDGGARANAEAWTRDGVHYTEQLLPFGVCAGGAGGAYERTSGPWVSWGPDGVAYTGALELDDTGFRRAIGAATSFDGGATWKYAQPVIADDDPAISDDKNSVTADPDRPGTAYQVWDRLDQPLDAQGNALSFNGPGYLSITHDHGRTWSKPAVMADTSGIPFTQTVGNVIVVDPRTGDLYDFFDMISFTDATTDTFAAFNQDFVKSTDGGRTWSLPAKAATDSSVFDVDPANPAKILRTGAGNPSPAVDPVTGELYLAYEGSDFTGGAVDQIELVDSTDGGRTWSAPVRVNLDPDTPAFTPSIAVGRDGTVHVSYYDLRDLSAGDTTTLPTSTWLLSFPRGHEQQATEQRIAPDFDWLLAPFANGYMLADYTGLALAGRDGVQPIFVSTSAAPGTSTGVFTGVFRGRSDTAPAPTSARAYSVGHPAGAAVRPHAGAVVDH
jgi:hypothetical protein